MRELFSNLESNHGQLVEIHSNYTHLSCISPLTNNMLQIMQMLYGGRAIWPIRQVLQPADALNLCRTNSLSQGASGNVSPLLELTDFLDFFLTPVCIIVLDGLNDVRRMHRTEI